MSCCPVIDLTSDDECTLVDVMNPFTPQSIPGNIQPASRIPSLGNSTQSHHRESFSSREAVSMAIEYSSKRRKVIDVKGKDPLSFFSRKENICKSGNMDIFRFLMLVAYDYIERVPSHDFGDLKKKIRGAALTYSKAAVAVANSKTRISTTSQLISLKGIGETITSKVLERGLIVVDITRD